MMWSFSWLMILACQHGPSPICSLMHPTIFWIGPIVRHSLSQDVVMQIDNLDKQDRKSRREGCFGKSGTELKRLHRRRTRNRAMLAELRHPRQIIQAMINDIHLSCALQAVSHHIVKAASSTHLRREADARAFS